MELSAFWQSFGVALIGTLKVFAMGLAGFIFVKRGWLETNGLRVIGRLVAWLTLPCLIIYRFAIGFNPQTFPDWWKFVFIGTLITIGGMLLGKIVALRHGNNDEATLVVGFQNCGFFVLPMLQALLPPQEYSRGVLMLFMLTIPFNSSLWFCGNWFLLHKKSFDWRTLLTPPLCATVFSLIVYGVFHDWTHTFNETIPIQVLFGDAKTPGDVGAVQLIGDLTIPLATILLGASIADSLRGPVADLEGKRAALETTFMKMILYPALGFGALHFIGTQSSNPLWRDPTVLVLLILQFAAPPATALSVFAQENNYIAKFIPLACLISYIICLITVPFFVALVR
jgi:predicted permease